MANLKHISTILLCLLGGFQSSVSEKSEQSTVQFSWRCENEKCIKETVKDQPTKQITSFEVCKLFCGPSIIWPLPTTYTLNLSPVYIKSISVKHKKVDNEIPEKLESLLDGAENVFQERIKCEKSNTLTFIEDGAHNLMVELDINDLLHHSLTLSTDESYSLTVEEVDNMMLASIKGETFFGVRHGLETLAQIIVYDSINNMLVMPNIVKVSDKPHYPYRGLMLDTSRNYISVKSIKRTINAMAANKLNSFHWHITDSQSFPLKLNGFQQFAEYGAYSKDKVYTEKDVKGIVEYASYHGIRVVPELDAPAHTGEGWQWAPSGTILCVNKEPWQSFCTEPPCGQLNPLSKYTYSILGELYSNYKRLFKSDIFHMGGDEVHFGCWHTSKEIQEWIAKNYAINMDTNKNTTEPATNQSNKFTKNAKEGYFKLWNKFQETALKTFREAYVKASQPEVVLWSSELTKGENLNKFLNSTDYIIQVWSRRNDHMINELLDKDFRIIVSNYDALYFDSGFGSWVTDHSDSIYRPWHTVYGNILPVTETLSEEKKRLILGQEAALWTEKTSEGSLDSKLWPRAAALAERTWSNPETDWRNAESRILYHRDRLVRLGINADAIEPEWCNINRGGCS